MEGKKGIDTPLDTINGIQYFYYQTKHDAEGFEMTTKAFGDHEPIGKACGANQEQFKELFMLTWHHMVNNNLSIVAVDEESQKVAGVFTAWDPTKMMEAGMCAMMSMMSQFDKVLKKYPGLKPFCEISQEVQKPIEALHKKHKTKGDSGVICELLTVAVSPDFGGKGIATNLSKICVENAKQAGFKVIYSETTGVGSTKAIAKCGGEIKNTIDYATWTYGKGCFSKGTQPLTKVEEPHKGINLMVIMNA